MKERDIQRNGKGKWVFLNGRWWRNLHIVNLFCVINPIQFSSLTWIGNNLRCMAAQSVCPPSFKHAQSVLYPTRKVLHGMAGNKMAACLSPWPGAEPAKVDTTTQEGSEMAGAERPYLTVFSQQESYSPGPIQPLNFNLSPLTQNSFPSIWHVSSCEESILGIRHDVVCFKWFSSFTMWWEVGWASLPAERGFRTRAGGGQPALS